MAQRHVAVEAVVSPDYRWLWSAALAIALFYPVRQLIWVLSVRRVQKRIGALPDQEARDSLKRRAGVTSLLLCLIFAAGFGGATFGGPG